jgi:hypothetical protein
MSLLMLMMALVIGLLLLAAIGPFAGIEIAFGLVGAGLGVLLALLSGAGALAAALLVAGLAVVAAIVAAAGALALAVLLLPLALLGALAAALTPVLLPLALLAALIWLLVAASRPAPAPSTALSRPVSRVLPAR